ncbi:MAG: hypothetical protein OEW75_14005 [Cyclobacteriaceae bacterium]|nr:hypothetical protein [Cyclobacteriaceae bacterium]
MNASKTYVFKKLSAAGNEEKSIISAQFVKVVDRLKADRHFALDEEFCEHYGYSKKMLNHIRKGRQDVSIDLLYNVVLDWKINPYFIFGISDQVYEQ